VLYLCCLGRFRHTWAAPVAALAAAGLTTEPKGVRDTVVVPAQRECFDKAFISANAWWATLRGHAFSGQEHQES
jgi:hypothetical protein